MGNRGGNTASKAANLVKKGKAAVKKGDDKKVAKKAAATVKDAKKGAKKDDKKKDEKKKAQMDEVENFSQMDNDQLELLAELLQGTSNPLSAEQLAQSLDDTHQPLNLAQLSSKSYESEEQIGCMPGDAGMGGGFG